MVRDHLPPLPAAAHSTHHLETLYSIFISHKLHRKEYYGDIPYSFFLIISHKPMIPASQSPSPSLTFSLIIIRTPDQTQAGLRLAPSPQQWLHSAPSNTMLGLLGLGRQHSFRIYHHHDYFVKWMVDVRGIFDTFEPAPDY